MTLLVPTAGRGPAAAELAGALVQSSILPVPGRPWNSKDHRQSAAAASVAETYIIARGLPGGAPPPTLVSALLRDGQGRRGQSPALSHPGRISPESGRAGSCAG